ncbi:MAG: hypothetical protein MUO75_05310 [Actinobacteria bacterium]|nr:hypothetical protein [Actinomycetota bacterium]
MPERAGMKRKGLQAPRLQGATRGGALPVVGDDRAARLPNLEVNIEELNLYSEVDRSPKYGILCHIRLTFLRGLPAR